MSGHEIPLFIAALGIIAAMLIMVNRIWHGPSVFDRLNALALIGTDTILLLSIIGIMTGQMKDYADIAITYALIGFISLVIIARYITKRRLDIDALTPADTGGQAPEEAEPNPTEPNPTEPNPAEPNPTMTETNPTFPKETEETK